MKVHIDVMGDLNLSNATDLDILERIVKQARKNLTPAAPVNGKKTKTKKYSPDAIILLGDVPVKEKTNMDKVVALFESLEAKKGAGMVTRGELMAACKDRKSFPQWVRTGGVPTAINAGHLKVS